MIKQRTWVLALGGTLILALVVFLAPVGVVRGADAASMPDCTGATIAALSTCVTHAAEMGVITNQGIATSLQAKLASAQAALDRGQTTTAVRLLHAFIHEVQGQSGKHIEAEHATHMIEHAQMVIEALP